MISNAYNYLDIKRDMYEKYICKNCKNSNFDIQETTTTETIQPFTYSENNKVILEGDCNLIGLYNNELNIWYWAWALPLNKKMNYISRKLINYALDMNIDDIVLNNNNDKILYYKTKAELLNAKTHVTYKNIEIEKYIAMSIYLTKSDYYFKIPIVELSVTTNKEYITGELYYMLRNIKII